MLCFIQFFSLLNLNRVIRMNASHGVQFNITPSLKERMEHWDVEAVDDDLFKLLSPTSPERIPTASPTLKAVESKEGDSDPSPAVETTQERLKRRRRVQGQKNHTKRPHKVKQEERDGPPVRLDVAAKYEANSTSFFSSTSAADSSVASTGYVVLNRSIASKKAHSLTELEALGFDILDWDGR